MHEGVKHEIVEDGALGKKVKESGYKMRIVRGDHLIDAVWARDSKTLWQALKRLMIPLYLQSEKIAIGSFLQFYFYYLFHFQYLQLQISYQLNQCQQNYSIIQQQQHPF